MDMEREIKRLKRSVTSLWALLFLSVLGGLGWRTLSEARASTYQLKVRRYADGIHLTASSDGPFVVTHLAIPWEGLSSGLEQRVAALDPPLAIVESEGGTISNVKNLKWTNIRGEPADPPGPEQKITALYFRPEWAEPRDP